MGKYLEKLKDKLNNKKIRIIMFGSIGVLAVSLIGIFGYNSSLYSKIKNKNSSINNQNNYLGSYYQGNYVWGGAMNLAWNELNENILREKLQLNTTDQIALAMVEKLNNSPFSKTDLDEASYYIKSGYGPETLDEINRESKKKFPSKSFGDLEIDLGPKDIISYAYFLKEVEYLKKFKKDVMSFKDTKVESFSADNNDQKKAIKILEYQNDDRFIVKLELKEKEDQLFLAKGYDMQNLQNIVNKINQHNSNTLPSLDKDDVFDAPKLHFEYKRDYKELIEKFLANKDFEEYYIAEMFENIKFDMDEEGARVENEGVIVFGFGLAQPSQKEKPKKIILDKPYRVIMKKSDSKNPYFILGVNNTEIMEIL